MNDTASHPDQERKGERLQRDVSNHLERLSAELAKGKPEELVAYLKSMGQFYKYSWNNALLIFVQRPNAGRVAGFHAWKRFGRHVKKGAQGISIMAPILKERENEAGQKVKMCVAIAGSTVFSEFDTEGEALPELDIGSAKGGSIEALHAAIQAARTQFPVEYKAQAAYGSTDGQTITLDPLKCDENPGTALVTLFHEWAHCLLHVKGGKAREEARGKTKGQIELEAEAVGFVLGSLHGVDSLPSTNTYIQSWGGNAQALQAALTDIGHCVQSIMRVLNPAEFNETEKAREAARKSAQKRWGAKAKAA